MKDGNKDKPKFEAISGLMMTPQLQHAIKLLTLSHMEMQNAISEEMVENPLLEEYNSGNSQNETDNSEYIALAMENQNRETKSEDFDETDTATQEDHFEQVRRFF